MRVKKTNTYCIYTIFFLMTAALCFSFFYRYGKSMVWGNDGLYQHYNAFLYLGSWVREIFHTLFSEHRLVIPMWEWGLGFGGDAILTLSYYTIGDPFALISVFTPYKYGEIGYAISILLRFYTAGLAFCLYCRKMKCQKWTTICAAIMYTFCSYSIFAGVRHPYFMNPMIYFPLVLFGCEKIIRKESPVPFILAVFLSAISNFYFFYMIVLLTVLYVFVRLLSAKNWRQPKIIGAYFAKFLGAAILGVALAAVLFLPNCMNFLQSDRVNDAYTFANHYTRAEYEALFGSFVGIDQGIYWAFVGMAPLAYLGVCSVLLNRKKDEIWSAVFCGIQILFLLFPIAGHIFNGFGYVCNRWVFAWAFIVAFMFAKSFPDLLHLSNRKKAILSIGCSVYCLLCAALEYASIRENLVGCILLLICLLFVWCADSVKPLEKGKLHISGYRLIQIITAALTICLVFEIAYFRYASVERNYLAEFHDSNSANQILANDRADVLSLIDDDDTFYRVDNSSNNNHQLNFLVSSRLNTTSIYWSLINPCIAEFSKNNGTCLENSYQFYGFNSRAWLLPLFSAKYFVTSDKKAAKKSVPYGYDYVGEKPGEYGTCFLYRSNNALPFGYTFDKVISLRDYQQMSISQRQQALLQGAVLKNADAEAMGLAACQPSYSDKIISYKIKPGKNITISGNQIIVKEDKAKLRLKLDRSPEGELYVSITGLNFESCSEPPSTYTFITGVCRKAKSRVQHFTNYDIYAEGRTDYLLNLGYSNMKRSVVELKFSYKGIYTFDDLSVIEQPMDTLSDYVDALRQDTLENVTMDTNHISGAIHLDKKKLLCLSLPYSKGWHVTVDGEDADLLQTNIMLSGVLLEPGTHTIELSYCTPYIRQGVLISACAIIVLIFVSILFRKRKKKGLCS